MTNTSYNFFLDFDLSQPINWLIATSLFFAAVIFRYFLVAGVFHLIVYRKGAPASSNQIRMEIYWSVVTSVIFAVIGVFMWWAWRNGWTAIYTDFPHRSFRGSEGADGISLHTIGYLWPVISFLITLFIHETYFYFVHRFLHRPALLKTVHRVHHLSNKPTAWTAFSFNPSEALLEALIVPAILFVVPMHYVTLVCYLTFMTVTSVINHLSEEVYPKGTARHWLGKWFIGATHHGQHHKYYNCNYGLYLTFWDRLLGTHRSDYEDSFDDWVQRRGKGGSREGANGSFAPNPTAPNLHAGY